jgi:nuclear pore complex protein Nup210
VSLFCEFSTSGSKKQPMLYSSSLSVTVVPDLPLALGFPITWILPPYYTTTSLLPSSSESYTQYDGQTRKGTIKYSSFSLDKNAMQKDAVFIDGDRIKTTEANNLACIQAKDRTTGRIVIASCVEVAEVWILSFTCYLFGDHLLALAFSGVSSFNFTQWVFRALNGVKHV